MRAGEKKYTKIACTCMFIILQQNLKPATSGCNPTVLFTEILVGRMECNIGRRQEADKIAVKLLYFLEKYPRVLLISDPAMVWTLFEDRCYLRMGSIYMYFTIAMCGLVKLLHMQP